MYSFDNKDNSYKYESIQHGYEIEYYDDGQLKRFNELEIPWFEKF